MSEANEVFIELTDAALRAITGGHEIVFDTGHGWQVVLCCDDETVERFGKAIQRALLQMLPTSSTIH